MEYCVVDYYNGEVLFTSSDDAACWRWAVRNCGEPLSDGRIMYRRWEDRKWGRDITVYDFGRKVVAIY